MQTTCAPYAFYLAISKSKQLLTTTTTTAGYDSEMVEKKENIQAKCEIALATTSKKEKNQKEREANNMYLYNREEVSDRDRARHGKRRVFISLPLPLLLQVPYENNNGENRLSSSLRNCFAKYTQLTLLLLRLLLFHIWEGDAVSTSGVVVVVVRSFVCSEPKC